MEVSPGYWAMWSALVVFALASIGTPGPNNLMLTASGANFGVRRTIPHMLGIASGFAFMLLIVGVARREATEFVPMLVPVLKWVTMVVIFYLAYRIATAGIRHPPGQTMDNASGHSNNSKPFSFWQAAAFQWVNPKAWLISLVVTTQYIFEELTFMPQLLLVVLTFWCVTMLITPFWTWFGKQIAVLLQRPLRLHFFNVTMAILLIASVVPAMLDL